MSADRSITQEDWKELVDNNESFAEEFKKVFDNPDVSDFDEFSPDNFDGYVNMEIAMDTSGEEPHPTKVIK